MKKIIPAVALFVLIAGCSNSHITSSWKAKDTAPASYNKILVLGLMNEPDRSIREQMEQHLVGDLKALGYNAVCSCDEFDPKAFENMNEQEALQKLRNSGVDAVLTVVLLNKTKERYYVPGRIYYSPYAVYHYRFYGYYRAMYERIYTPGYYTTDTKYFWESNFYAVDGKNVLLYSAQSQSFDPASTPSLSHEYGQMIVKDMVKKQVLADQKAEKKQLATY